METLSQIVAKIDAIVWGVPLLVLLVGCHLYLTFRLKFIQRYIPLGIKLSIMKDSDQKGEISQFGSLAIALAATIGTGNIIGIATAIVSGGPGAVFWCWFCGIFAIATKYSEALLSIKFRVSDSEGIYHGGPMYAIERGMKQKWLAVLFALFTICASFGVGNMTQSNAVQSFTNEVLHVPYWITGLCEMVLIALVVIGGAKAVAKVCSVLVPFMAVFYVLGVLVAMAICYNTLLPAVSLILSSAFSTKAVGGGLLGTSIMLAMRYGIARGLFSNESGLGSAPIIAASAKTRNPVRQALISSTGTFWDTVLICAMTGIIQVAAVLKLNPDADFSTYKAQELAKISFANIPGGIYILTVALVIFACTTILGWFCYGQQAIYYLGGNKAMNLYKFIFVIMIYQGAVIKLDLVWNFSDIANGLMAIPNIICLFVLSHIVVKETNRYLKHGSIDDFAD